MLYEKFRPKKFEDVIGQNENSIILKKQVNAGKIAHSYLFEGNRGSGKTTSARILAKAINCESPINGEPCCKCKSCISVENKTSVDVIEIDAASNNGVDNVRNIIDDMKYAPRGKYKVYIIDEAHMLSKSAANAFLKTLEEPPKFGVFILCTTEAEALPITILSRCQKYNFGRIKVNDIKNRLEYICKVLNKTIDNKSLELISKVSDGAMRDAISVLEQVLSANMSSYNQVTKLLGVSSNTTAYKLLAHLMRNDSKSAIETFYTILENGKDIKKFTAFMIETLRNVMIIKSGADKSILKISDEDIQVLSKVAMILPFEKILLYLDILQEAFSQMDKSQFKAMIFEMAIIKITTPCENTTKIKEVNQVKEVKKGEVVTTSISAAKTSVTDSESALSAPGSSDIPKQEEASTVANKANSNNNTTKDTTDVSKKIHSEAQIVRIVNQTTKGMVKFFKNVSEKNNNKLYLDISNALSRSGIAKSDGANKIYVLTDLEEDKKLLSKLINQNTVLKEQYSKALNMDIEIVVL